MNINLFMELVKEDNEKFGSFAKTGNATGIKKTTIGHWINEIKSPPSYEKLETYVSNIDAPIERKRLYYEYCGYPVPSELLGDGVPETPKTESDFTKKEQELVNRYRNIDSKKQKIIDTIIDEFTYEVTIEDEGLIEDNKEKMDNIKKHNVAVELPDGTVLYVHPKDNNPETIALIEKIIKENKS